MRALKTTTRAAALALTLAIVSGCTIRYSQSMVGAVEKMTPPPPVANSDSGIEIGLGLPIAGQAGPVGIAFSEPDSAEELLSLPCEVALAEVDYRGIFYVFYIAAVFPAVETTSYCVQ
jgi:hypothetical protein